MTTFIQFHVLTAYPPSNPNRDDQGRPKSALVGGATRLRLSSQSIKRAIRESSFFRNQFRNDADGHLPDKNLGARSKRFGRELESIAISEGADEKTAREISKRLTEVMGKLEAADKKSGNPPETSALVFLSPDEWDAMKGFVKKAIAGEPFPSRAELAKIILRSADAAVDIAMFGRMLAGEEKFNIAQFNREAAVQVGHSITTHRVIADDDWYTAVDELNRNDETGAGHLDGNGFGSGVFYLYVCVNADLLVENLGGDRDLAARGIESLARALATATPRGKQNSFAHHPRAGYIRAECGPQQPRDLSGAFFHPVPDRSDSGIMRESIEAMGRTVDQIDAAYGASSAADQIMDVAAGQGTLDDIAAFAAKAVRDGCGD